VGNHDEGKKDQRKKEEGRRKWTYRISIRTTSQEIHDRVRELGLD